MKKHIILVILTIAMAASFLSGCSKKDKNTTVIINEDNVVDVND